MAVHNMACPNCGKQATEYDEDKWQCLHCGNKFVYKIEPTPVFNTSINVVGSPLYDVEVGATNNKPVMVPWLSLYDFEDDIEIQRLRKQQNIFGLLFCLVSPLFAPLLLVLGRLLGGFVAWLDPAGNTLAIRTVWLLASLFEVLVVVVAFVWRFPTARARKKYLQNLKVQVSTKVFCPYCKKLYETFAVVRRVGRRVESLHIHHLTHCKECGKQFLMDGLNSYCIKFK